MTADSPTAQIKLPDELTSSTDLARITRELVALDESLYQANLRTPGKPTKLARSSRLLEDLAAANGVSLLEATHRRQLIELLKSLSLHAPKIHMSVAAEPSGVFVRKITFWLRGNIHPLMLLDIGLQPTLAAGCMIRTNNKVFDMSLRHRFSENRHLLKEKIEEHGKEKASK